MNLTEARAAFDAACQTAMELKRNRHDYCSDPSPEDIAAAGVPEAREALAVAKWEACKNGARGKWGRQRAAIVTFGLGGHGVHYRDSQSRLSGYSSPENWDPRQACMADGERYTDNVTDFAGAWVVDSRAMFERDPGLAFALPMIDGTLKGEAVDAFVDRNAPIVGMIAESPDSGAFGSLCRMAVAEEFKGLDFVSPEAYVAAVRALGARVGRIGEDGRIAWE